MSQPPTEGDPTETRRIPDRGQPPPPPGRGQHPPPEQGHYPPPGQGEQPAPAPWSDRDQTAEFPAVGPAPYPQAGGHPPPGQGGYPPPAQGGYPPGQGGYPPPGPGAYAVGQGPGAPYGPPPGYPPGRPGDHGVPPPAGRSRRNLVIALVAGLVVLAGAIVAVVVILANRSSDPVADEGTTAAATTPSSEAAPSSTAPSTTSEAPTPTPTAGGADELLAVLPADFVECTAADPAGDGDVAAATCGPSITQPGPSTGAFYLYPDPGTLDQVFADDVSEVGLTEMPSGEDCRTSEGVTTWTADGVEGGEVACAITNEGVQIAWTDREFGIEGIVTMPGSTQEDLATLTEWWFQNSGYQR
jgi:hypothetical protein